MISVTDGELKLNNFFLKTHYLHFIYIYNVRRNNLLKYTLEFKYF